MTLTEATIAAFRDAQVAVPRLSHWKHRDTGQCVMVRHLAVQSCGNRIAVNYIPTSGPMAQSITRTAPISDFIDGPFQRLTADF